MTENITQDLPKPRILIVDPDTAVTKLLSTQLSGFASIEIANSGKEAIELLKVGEFDAILTEHEMKNGSGFDIVDYINRAERFIPVVVITSFNSISVAIKMIEAHVYNIIEKPFINSHVEEVVKEVLKYSREQRKIKRLASIGVTTSELFQEIASPITTLCASLEAMMSLEPASSTLDVANSSINKIKKLISATIAAVVGEEQYEFHDFRIYEWLLSAEQDFKARSREKKVPVLITGSLDIVLWGDKDKIRQAIVNLVNNGIDAAASLPEKWVKINIQKGTSSTLISIIDSGHGIPKDIVEKLFKPFFTTKGNDGTGLGLDTSRRIAQAHGGNVFLVSDGPNTQFVLVLPMGHGAIRKTPIG